MISFAKNNEQRHEKSHGARYSFSSLSDCQFNKDTKNTCAGENGILS